MGHLGEWRCAACGRSRLSLDVAARAIELNGLDGSAFTLSTPEGTARVRLHLPGLYNIYNATAAAALTGMLGVPVEEIAAGLKSFTAAFGRFERIAIGDERVLMLLIKNPAGANEAVRTLLDGAPPRRAVIALNDDIADGRDVSWIWDVDFEPLLAGFDEVIVSGLEQALDRGLAQTAAGGELVVLPTYTAMLRLRGMIARRGHVGEYWETG